MNIKLTLACVSAAAIMAACAPAGYYDSNGVYRSYGKSDSFNHNRPMAGTPDTPAYPGGYDRSDRYPDYAPASAGAYSFTRPGYYDYQGYYIAPGAGPSISQDLFPPRGMCRVWFTDRPPSEQPPVESCAGIHARVPMGAYVIYGG